MDSDEYLLDLARNTKVNTNIHEGVIASGDIFVTSPEMSKKICTKFNALAVEMEGAAIAQVSSLNSVPFTVIRLISDLPSGKGPDDYNKFEKEAATMSSLALETFLEQ